MEKFVISYTRLDLDKSVSTAVVCLMAESAAQVKTAVRQAVEEGVLRNAIDFKFAGESLYVHDFVSYINPDKWEYCVAVAKKRGKKEPASMMYLGDRYVFKAFTVLPLEEWFQASLKTEAAPTSALTLSVNLSTATH
jgi:hypothetical protein